MDVVCMAVYVRERCVSQLCTDCGLSRQGKTSSTTKSGPRINHCNRQRTNERMNEAVEMSGTLGAWDEAGAGMLGLSQ